MLPEFHMPFNELVRVVGLPLLFIIFNVMAEILQSISCKGVVQKGRTIKVVYKDKDDQLQEWHTEPSKVADFKQTHPHATTIVTIDQRATYQWYDYPSISLNLCFAALLADGMSLFSPKVNEVIGAYRWLFILHIGILILVLLLNINAMKKEDNESRKKVMIWSVGIAFAGAVIGFIALRSVL